MFTLGFGLLIAHLGAYILLPLIPGMITAWILMDNRFRSWLYYILSWFIGVGVLGYGMFLLQFVRFGVDRVAYAILVAFLLVVLFVKMKITKTSRKSLCKTLSLSCNIEWKENASKWYNTKTIMLAVYVLLFVGVTFVFVTNLPSYGDDAFGNWHLPVMNIIYDGGVKIFGVAGEILGRARLGYPIMIPTLQAFVSTVVGGYNDIYSNIFPWLSATMFLLFIGIYTYQKKRSVLVSLVGPALIISLPLVFIHTTQGYMDFLSAIYTSLAVIALYEWLQEDGKKQDLILGVTMLSILSYIKNDGFVVYMMGVLIALALYFFIHRKRAVEKLSILKKPSVWITLILIVLFFIAPFTFLKSYYDLGFNQAAGADTGLGLAAGIHREIFPAIRRTIRSMNNYSIAPLLFVIVMAWYAMNHKKMNKEQCFLVLSPLVILGIFLLVFLLTENYKFVLDQTTVNRVFTMVLVIFFSSLPLVFPVDKSAE